MDRYLVTVAPHMHPTQQSLELLMKALTEGHLVIVVPEGITISLLPTTEPRTPREAVVFEQHGRAITLEP
jgi:hypothetical protein